jgi:hypothetical protein
MPPHFADAQEEQQLWEEIRDHSASLNRVLNEAMRIHGGPRVACLPGASAFACLSLSSSLLSFSRLSSRCSTHGFCLLTAGAGAPRSRQVRRPRPDEC